MFTTSTASTPASAPACSRNVSGSARFTLSLHSGSHASTTRGARTLRALAWWRTASNAESSRSVGRNAKSGSSPERCAQCCPVPHASSTTTPPVGAHALSRGANASAIGTLFRSAAEEEAALLNVPKSLDMVSASGAGSGEAEARVAKGARARRTPGLAARDRAEQTLAREAAAETRQSSEAIGRSPRGVTKVWAMEASRLRKLGACAGDPVDAPGTTTGIFRSFVLTRQTTLCRNFEGTRVDPSVFPPPAHHRARRRTSRIVRLVTPRSPSPGRLSTSPTRRFPRRSRSNADHIS